jgi:hypothetical protein
VRSPRIRRPEAVIPPERGAPRRKVSAAAAHFDIVSPIQLRETLASLPSQTHFSFLYARRGNVSNGRGAEKIMGSPRAIQREVKREIQASLC